MHEDGTTAVNTEDPAWELALAEVAKDNHRIVTNAPLAEAAGAAEAEGGPGAEVVVIDGNGVHEAGEDEDEGEDELEMSAAAQVAEMEEHLLAERSDDVD